MNTAQLYVFAISHYCEKARWGLDHQGIDYALHHLAPGAHVEVAKRLGAAGSSLPLLVADGEVVQGSGAILDWGDASTRDPSRRLALDADLAAEGRDVEQRLDDVSGVHVRRYYYSEAMVDHPDTVRPIFVRDLPPEERHPVEESWGVVRQLMIAAMDLGAEQRLDSRDIVARELDWLDGLLGDGRRYLLGDRLSRVDVTAASLFAPLALPEEHPSYGALEVPPLARADLAEWATRPSLRWVRETYARHRLRGGGEPAR